MTDPLTGGCACGAVRYAAQGEPKFAFICQCRACQQMSGSDHAVGFGIDTANLTVAGPLNRYDRVADSGHSVTTHFCPQCGTPIYNDPARAAGLCMVTVGSLDDPSAVRPDRIFYAEQKISWDLVTTPTGSP